MRPRAPGDDRQKPLGDVPLMHEEAEAAGLHSVYDGPWEFFVGGGGAAFDCDGSGFPSVFLAGGKNPARLFVNKSKAGGPLKFEEKPLDIGADPKLLTNVIGAYPIDIDGDGHMDLFVLRVGGNLMLKGGPDCTFTLANQEWNFDGDPGWTTSFAAEWEPGQKFPTLAIGHYVDRDAPGSPWGTCEENSLYRPQAGDKPDYSVRTPLAPGFCALSMLFTDWNKSGEPSLRVSNDRQYYRGGEEQMWRIEPGKTPRLYTRADGWRHLSIFGMGIAEGDLDGSGYPQYFLTSMGDEKLQKLDPEEAERGEAPVYRDIAGEVGATAHIPYAGGDKRPSTAWHAEFADFNNDGLLDIFVSKGNLEQMPDFAAYDPSNLLLGQWNGKFAEAGDEAGIACNAKGRGALIADFNLDGRLDILQINRGSNVLLCSAISAPRMATGRRCRWATGSRSGSSSRTPTATRSARRSRSRPERAPRPASSTSAAATPRATRAGSMSASARPSARKSACNGRTAIGAHLPGVRQPVRGRRPHEAAGGLLVSGAVDRLRRRRAARLDLTRRDLSSP